MVRGRIGQVQMEAQGIVFHSLPYFLVGRESNFFFRSQARMDFWRSLLRWGFRIAQDDHKLGIRCHNWEVVDLSVAEDPFDLERSLPSSALHQVVCLSHNPAPDNLPFHVHLDLRNSSYHRRNTVSSSVALTCLV